MHVLVVASQKGGAGKTTLSRNLATEAERVGAGPVLMVDCDPQATLSNWWNRRKTEKPDLLQSSLDALPQHLKSAERKGYTLAVIDTPPQVTDAITRIVQLGDLVVIPVRPSPDDLDAIGATIGIVDACGKPMTFVVNQANKAAKLTGQAAIKLSKYGTVAEPIITMSQDIPKAAILGLGVSEFIASPKRGDPADQVSELWLYVQGLLEKHAGRPAPAAA